MTVLIQMLLSACLTVFWKICSQPFFEAVVSKVVIAALEKLAPMTSNTVDDAIVAEIKVRLQPGAPNADALFLQALNEAVAKKDYNEVARLTNERAGR